MSKLAAELGLWSTFLACWVCGCAGQQLPKSQITTPAEALFNGQVRPDIDCYRCHNGDATGTWRGPNLTQNVKKLTDQQIATTIDTGPGLMPSYRGKLSQSEVQQIIAWLRSRSEKG
jgi:mono/diheme cytochrome c family protein